MNRLNVVDKIVLPREAIVRAARKFRVLDTAVVDAGAETEADAEEAAAPLTLIRASMIPRFVISAGLSSEAEAAVAEVVSWCRRTSGRDDIAIVHR